MSEEKATEKIVEEILIELLFAFEEVVARLPEYQHPFQTNAEMCDRMTQARRAIQKAQKFLYEEWGREDEIYRKENRVFLAAFGIGEEEE